ncbi:hypothetical protein [Mycobacterium timonense]|uniref:Uncharacterized protein n=1 Tax=Mycobacterium timonense TaxID=701043 RepID=A0ABX3TSE5_9MYCO|nr:hypothetical protein [Mycobacterium timonense]ETB44369.1 hypothetical protein N602_03170 [Mycobacterium avium subsp. hominissuis 10-5606]ORB81750.1 hypothetical protein BST46_01765 [Mycobacterium timonense]
MPRIRTIKPEFWDSPDTAAADLRTRLLYIAMWNWADDYGIGDATPVRLIGFAFPNDEIPVSDYPRILSEVSRAYGVVFFEHSGRRYFVIPEWEKHQRTEKRAKPNEALIEAANAAISAAQRPDAESPRNSAEIPPLSDGTPGAGTGEQGNRGTGEPPYPPNEQPALPARRKPRDGSGEALARVRELNANARSTTAYGIAEAFSASLPVPIERGHLVEIGKQIDKCLRSNIPPPAIAAGLKAWSSSDSWSPTQIPNFVHKANNGALADKATAKAVGYADAADELLAEVTTL